MKKIVLRVFLAAAVLLFCTGVSHAAGSIPKDCVLQFIAHGTLHQVGECWQFVDDLNNEFEVLGAKPGWEDGMEGTVYAEWAEAGVCGDLGTPLNVCLWDADYSTTVTGELVFINFIECPGYHIRTGKGDYFIRNCEDFPPSDTLCDQQYLGRRVRVDLIVDTGVTICLGVFVSDIINFEFVN